MKKNICDTCAYCTNNDRCNRLAIPGGFGRNDRLGSDFKHNNQCPYFKEGNSNREIIIDNMPMYNS